MADSRPSLAKMRQYAWANVVTGFLVWGIGLAGVSMMMPVMYSNISETMDWTVAQTTSFMVIKSAVSALAGLFAGALFVRFSLKQVLLPSVWAVGVSTLALYFVKQSSSDLVTARIQLFLRGIVKCVHIAGDIAGIRPARSATAQPQG